MDKDLYDSGEYDPDEIDDAALTDKVNEITDLPSSDEETEIPSSEDKIELSFSDEETEIPSSDEKIHISFPDEEPEFSLPDGESDMSAPYWDEDDEEEDYPVRERVAVPRMRTGEKVFWVLYYLVLAGLLFSQREVVKGILHFGEKEIEGGQWVLCILCAAIVLSAVLSLFVLRPARLRSKRRRKGKRYIRLYHLPAIICMDLYAFFIIEYVNNENFLEMEYFYMMLNVAGILIIHLIFLFWLNSVKFSMLAVLAIWSLGAIAFYLVFQFRGEPLQLIDILSAATAFEVAGNYTPVITRALVTDVIGFLCLVPMVLESTDACLSRKWFGKILIRVAVLIFMICGNYFYMNVGWNGQVGILTDLFSPIKTYRKYGTTVGFFCVAKYMRLTPPDDYSVSETEAIAETAAEEETPNTITDVKPTNIIVVMNESWSDYRMIGDLKTNQEIMPYYDSLKENTIKGHTLVCIKGGGTAKTEYEFLTGNSVKRFPGMVPYVSYFLHDQYSLVTTLEDQGYESVAMHPYKASNWKRPQAYRLLNFDHFYAEPDFDKDVKRLRSFVSDQGNYEQIVKMVSERDEDDPPLFLFDITMQNHGGYKKKSFTGDIEVEGYENEEVNRFLSLMHETDNALEYLIESFKKVDEPTLIVVFGDHFPTLPDEFTEMLSGKKYDDLTLSQQMNYFNTPFLIWANYDIPEMENVQTSVNYLGTMMLEATGLEMAHYNYYLKDLMQDMPALNHLGYMDADGRYHSWKKADELHDHLEWEYECLQYNELAEDRKRVDWFFQIPEDQRSSESGAIQE